MAQRYIAGYMYQIYISCLQLCFCYIAAAMIQFNGFVRRPSHLMWTNSVLWCCRTIEFNPESYTQRCQEASNVIEAI